MPKRKLPPNEQVLEMYYSGMSCGEIADKCGVAPVTVRSLLARIGYQARSMAEAAKVRAERGRWKPSASWKGKKVPRELVERRSEKVRGEKHYLWKGGLSRRPYRNVIEKIECDKCGVRENLSIHHINLDHYDNRPENLQVLCVSCHMSVHKQAYWDAIHAGKEPPKSNAPIGWNRDE